MFEKFKSRLAARWGYGVSEAPMRDPKKTSIKKVGQALKGRGGGDFEESVVDLTEIYRAYNTDSYIKRAVDKYSEMIFKAGWDIASKNENASEYVWTRLKLMAEGTGQPIDEFLKEIAQNLVLFGNAFIVKARQKGSSPATGIKAQGYTGKQPVAGYFVLPPTTIKISRDEFGKILAYQQDVGGGETVDFKPEDMIHFYYKKPTGRAFGVPYIFTVLDDVKMLRQIEENVARLIYRNLFPLYQYKVGLAQPGFEASDEEIEELKEQIGLMPMDGAIVVPERHDISIVSSNSAILDASEYLKFFRQRVFSGLGVSDIVMGIGDTANRGTADNLSSEMVDGVKEYQAIFQLVFQSKIINELLFEGGFDPTLNPDDEVEFVFHEIELDSKIKRENHITQLFTQNVLTHEEMRAQLGLDPVADEERLYFNMVTKTLNAEAAKEKAAAANAAGANKDAPRNQNNSANESQNPALEEHSEDFSRNILTESTLRVNLHSELGIEQHSSTLKKTWQTFREDIITMVRNGKSAEFIKGFAIELTRQSIMFSTNRYLIDSFTKGIGDARMRLGITSPNRINTNAEVDKLTARTKRFVDRLMDDMTKLIIKAMEEESLDEAIAKITGAFNANEYRLAFTSNTELRRAFNYASVVVAKDEKLTEVYASGHVDCETCAQKAEQPISLDSVELLDTVPPHHPNCTCTIEFTKPVKEV